ncbi:protein piwi, putative [Pediculus humanus corporis]|uniref:Protein piwi, putative n=1 Tax=Pediculus humanus subsp. corporis TaxID=121224 RepID=E0W0U4_PEDHC|nr:protein piwi, putative [Pediculus humanus corporis]EEB19250.1 protein piwi, putative [Pediculus humanus corporis]
MSHVGGGDGPEEHGLGRGRGKRRKKTEAKQITIAPETNPCTVLEGKPGSSEPSCSSEKTAVSEGVPTKSDSSLATKIETLNLKTQDPGRSKYGQKRRSIPDIQSGSNYVTYTKPSKLLSKKGDFGTPIELVTNYFKLETVPNWVLYLYRVDFSVNEEREKILRSWLNQHRDRLKTAFIFDGSMLFTTQRLTATDEPLILTSIRDDGGDPVKITLRLVEPLQYGNPVYLQVFNILVRRCLMHLDLYLVNRNYYDPRASIHMPQHNIEIWPGYVTSIRQYEKDILMCAEITHKVMRTDTALKLLSDCCRESGNYKKIFHQAMIGAIVLTDYNNKTYRIDDVDFSLNPTCTFKYKNNENISYVDYYRQRYQLKIKDLRQPLLISRSNRKSLTSSEEEKQCILVPELCRMTGLDNRMLENRNLMKDLSDITRIPPHTRMERLKNFNRRLQNEKQVAEDLGRWQMKLSLQLMTVIGRELPPEEIITGGGKCTAGLEVDWTRSIRSVPMLKNGKFDTFVVICPYRLRRDTESFLSILKKTSSGMNFHIPLPNIFETRSDSPAEMVEKVDYVLAMCRPDLILFSFMSNRADRYSAVKKKCYVDRGIPSQVILARNLTSKGVMSIATKVAIQINSKIGGAPWTVNIPFDNFMVVGYDVCHDTVRKSKSVGALVASLNKAMNAWFSCVNFHENGEELSDTIALDICKALRKYKEINKSLPARIFVYRDGVGEGQINYVYKHEVEMLKKVLTDIYNGPNWKLSFIIVTKRIKTRFFNKERNPRPGTVVDDVVTLPERYDFYLVSQSVRQGTVSPTSYNIISDNVGWTPNHFQRFTYKLTHLYYNCSTSVGVPAPCQYAHKLAFLKEKKKKVQ